MTYAALEISRQAGAPLELYRFRVGALRAVIPVGEGEVLAASDSLDYVDLAAMAAAGWVFTDTHTKADWSGMDALVVQSGARSLKALTFGSSVGVLHAARAFGPADGIEPDTIYRLRTWTRMSTRPWYDVDTLVRLIGTSSKVRAYQGAPGEWVRLATDTAESDGAGLVTARLERVGGWSTVADIHFDQVELWKLTEPVEDEPAEIVFGFTSADVPVVFGAETYEQAIIIRGPFRYSDDESRSMDLVIEVPRDHPIVAFAGQPAPAPPVTCTVFRLHRGDLTDAIVPLITQVSRCEKIGAKARITLTPVTSLFEKSLPLEVLQKKCQAQLYGIVCQASRVGHEFPDLEVTAVDGRNITIAGLGVLAGVHLTRFTEGVLTGPDGSESTIESFDAASATPDVVRLLAVNPAVEVGSIVQLLDGCLKDVATCETLHNNLVHHRGEPVMPTRNPGTGAGLN